MTRSSHPSRSKSTKTADIPQVGLATPDFSVMSVNDLPSPLLRNSLTPPYWVTSTSGQPSLSMSPIATPMLYPGMSSPEPALTSAYVPSGFWRYRRLVDFDLGPPLVRK